jgi:hypothetical protein
MTPEPNMYRSTYVLSTRYLPPSKCASRFMLQHSPSKCFALSVLKHISRCKLDGEDSMCWAHTKKKLLSTWATNMSKPQYWYWYSTFSSPSGLTPRQLITFMVDKYSRSPLGFMDMPCPLHGPTCMNMCNNKTGSEYHLKHTIQKLFMAYLFVWNNRISLRTHRLLLHFHSHFV